MVKARVATVIGYTALGGSAGVSLVAWVLMIADAMHDGLPGSLIDNGAIGAVLVAAVILFMAGVLMLWLGHRAQTRGDGD